jgi:hypothetical protein
METWVITRRASDPYGFTVLGEVSELGSKPFTLKVLLKAKGYTLIHLHSFDRLLPWLRRLYPKKPVVLHYHGSDIRGRWREKAPLWRQADGLLVSTPDLLEGAPEDARYLPNPVDTSIFKPSHKAERVERLALHFNTGYPWSREDLEWARRVAARLQLKLQLIDRQAQPIPYLELPHILSSAEYLIDRRRIRSLSLVALQALACGVKVIDWREEVVEGLPQEHEPLQVARQTCDIYRELVEQ